MKNKLKISIVTPSCCEGEAIEKTILSVLNQNYDELEYFIVDYGSTDSTIAIVKKYQSRITFLTCENGRLQAHAINKGFREATGDIIAYINSGDVYCDGAFAAVAEYFSEHSEKQWVAGNVLYLDIKGNVVTRKKPVASPFLLKQGLMHLFQPNVFLRRSVLSTVGYLREDFDCIMDYEWFCRIGQKHMIGLLDKDMAKTRESSVPKTSRKTGTPAEYVYMKERIITHCQYIPLVKPVVYCFVSILIFCITTYGRTWRNLYRLRLKFFKP